MFYIVGRMNGVVEEILYKHASSAEELWAHIQDWGPEDFGFEETDDWDLELSIESEDGEEYISAELSCRTLRSLAQH